MELREELLRGVYTYGFESPSAIQQRAIVPLTKSRDIIAQAQSGTGKTATFSIGVLQTIDVTNPNPQVIILAPTRELANQSFRVASEIGSYMKLTAMCCIGGKGVQADIAQLRQHGA